MQQKNLFSPEQRLKPLSLDQRRAEPVVWIQRLAILSKPSKSADIRVIPFHRGLNIVRTEKRNPEESRSVAHDVGKTLLMRLLRFTLGEDWFASRDDAIRIREALPRGVVVGEWYVAGQLWSVIRPLNESDSEVSFAVKGSGWEMAIQAADSERLPMSRFTERIEEATFSEIPSLRLKGVPVGWKDALAWIARDCECGFRKTDTWRDRDVNPKGSRETKLNKLIMQWLMGLMSEVESSARNSREESKIQLKEAERHNSMKRERLQTLFDSLAKTAGFSSPQFDEVSEPLSLSDCAEELSVFIEKQAAEAKARLETYDKESNKEMETLRLQLIQLEDQKTAAVREAGELRTIHRTCVAHYDDEVKRESGPKQCPAQEECAWLIEIRKNEAAGRMDSEELHLERLKEKINDSLLKSKSATAKEKRFTEQLHKMQNEYFSKQIDAVTRKAALEKEGGRWGSLTTQVGELAVAIEELTSGQETVDAVRNRIDEDETLLTGEKENDERQSRQWELENCYTHVLTHVFGSDAEGIIQIEDGIKPKTAASLHAHGTALSAMARVIAFELSCLLGSMSGLGAHPRLLMHDGPREGEMEAELFRTLFETVRWLELISNEPDAAFQYIITTADVPEEFSQDHPAVVLTLDGRSEDGLLLKKRF